MRILIYGAGVIGSLYAVRLKESGADVTLLARGQRLADLERHGVVLEDYKTGQTTATAVPLVAELRPDDRYDLILVVMRSSQVASVLPALAANTSPTVAFIGNSASGPDDLIAALGAGRVLRGFAASGGLRDGHVVRFLSTGAKPQTITLGELSGEVTHRLREIGEILSRAGFAPQFEANIDAWLKTHLAVVLPLALCIYAAGGTTAALADQPKLISLGLDAIREGLRALEAAGIPITPRAVTAMLRMPKFVIASRFRRTARTKEAELGVAAHANAAKDEMAFLLSEFRRVVAESGRPAPALEKLAAMGLGG